MRLVIIGNGISGITSARHFRKNNPQAEILVISGESDFFFSRTALMYVFMGHMKFEHTKPYEDWFWEENRIDLLKDWVEKVDFDKKILSCAKKGEISYDKLVLATGSKPNKMVLEGSESQGIQALYSLQDLEKLEYNTKDVSKAIILGGGLIGVELAEMLITRNIEVEFIIREDRFWGNVLPEAESELIEGHLRKHKLKLSFNSSVEQFYADENGRVKGLKLNDGAQHSCEFVGITIGVSPNISFLKSTKLEINRGILVNPYLETNIEDVYALGDCAEFREALPGRSQIEQVWYTGRMMGECLGASLSGKKTAYEPGPWFNSAKFFDIEYQTYGKVGAKLGPAESSFQSVLTSKAELFHVVFETETRTVVGVNVLGIRLRHELMDRWLKQGISLHTLIEQLPSLDFNPEFGGSWIKAVQAKYTDEFGKNIKSGK